MLLLLQLLLTDGIGGLVQRAVPESRVLIDGFPSVFLPHLPLHHHTDHVMDEHVLVLNTTRYNILQLRWDTSSQHVNDSCEEASLTQ